MLKQQLTEAVTLSVGYDAKTKTHTREVATLPVVYDVETTTHTKAATLSVDYDAETTTYTKVVTLSVGRLVVVIDVNPSHGFWTTRLMKLFGHEGK